MCTVDVVCLRLLSCSDSTMETGEAQKDTLTRNCRQKNTQSHCADSKHHQLIPCSLFQVSGESDKESGTSDIDELLKVCYLKTCTCSVALLVLQLHDAYSQCLCYVCNRDAKLI